MPLVVDNLRHPRERDWPAESVVNVRVARPSALGNPYVLGRDGDRSTVIERYRRWLFDKIRTSDARVLAALNEIASAEDAGKTVRLLCHCFPARCHAEVIVSAVEWRRTAASDR